MTEYIEVPFSVSDRPGSAGKRLDAFLVDRLQAQSRAHVQRFIAEGRVFLRGRKAKASTRVDIKDTVIVRYPPRHEPEPRCKRLEILYEDDHLLAIDKPGDVLSHPSGKIVRNAVTTILAAQRPGQGLHLSHRLDRETSGVLLFAKNPVDAHVLGKQFEGRTVRKEYLALVRGHIPFERKVFDAPLGLKGGVIRIRQAVRLEEEGGVPAVTEFERLAAASRLSIVRARPRTGRLHQIRVHLAALGYPVLGDKLYSSDGHYFLKVIDTPLDEKDFLILGARRHMLHARSIEIRHPKGRLLTITSPSPPDFRETLIKEGFSSKDVFDIDKDTRFL